MSKSKFWKGVLFGAIAGGSLSLFDRTTRMSVLESCQRTTGRITHFAKHPQETIDCVTRSTRKLRLTIEEVGEEVSFISEKINELREITPQVVETVKGAKAAFTDPDSDDIEKKSQFKA